MRRNLATLKREECKLWATWGSSVDTEPRPAAERASIESLYAIFLDFPAGPLELVVERTA